MSYYNSSVVPCDIVGASDGILAGLRHDAMEEIAFARPLLGLKLARMVGTMAVRTILLYYSPTILRNYYTILLYDYYPGEMVVSELRACKATSRFARHANHRSHTLPHTMFSHFHTSMQTSIHTQVDAVTEMYLGGSEIAFAKTETRRRSCRISSGGDAAAAPAAQVFRHTTQYEVLTTVQY